MIRLAALRASDRAAWDRLASLRGGFMQSWAWSAFKELEGYRVIRLGVFRDEMLVGGGVAYLYPTPAEAHMVAIPDGPVLDWEAPWAAPALDAVLQALRDGPDGERVAVVRVEPRLEVVPAPLCDLPRAPVDLIPHETIEVPLGSEAAMLARMKPKGRYNARLAVRHGVEVVSSVNPADVHALHGVLEQTAAYHGFALEPKSFFVNLAQALLPAHGRLAFARYRGMTLAAALTVRHGDTVTYLYGGHVPLFTSVMASSALHWHVMRDAAADGFRVYDLYGYVPAGDPLHPYDGFSRFKDKLGGRPVARMGSRDVIFYDRLAEAALAVLGAGERA